MENDDLPDLGARKLLARTLAKKLIKSAGITTTPVSLQQVIEHLQTERALKVYKIAFGEKVSGLLVVCKSVNEEYASIAFNENHPWCRRRFTLAHEIGHLLLGHACSEGNRALHNEKEANTFAAELLMPGHMIKADYKRLRNLSELCKMYRVSKEALTIKIMESRLI
jgi:Zn-dependent peptidase ImmA (M78 family)